jgi:hypothetical protein
VSSAGPADGDELTALLERAGLDPSALVAHAPLPDGDEVWALRSTDESWFADWQALRRLVPVTGRWPLAMTSWGVEIDPVNRLGTDPRTGRDESPTGILGRLDGVDVDADLDALEAESLPMPLDEWFEYHQDATRQRCGSAPALDEVRAALGDEPLELEIERWLLRWELVEGGLTVVPGGDAPYLEWFEPRGQPVHVLLLPRREPWCAAAYTGGYEWEYPHRDLRPALFRRWSEQYGAEPAANWDTMMQLVVTRPPSTVEDAFGLARAMTLLWPSTNGGPGITVREMAFDLVGRNSWFLHCRP